MIELPSVINKIRHESDYSNHMKDVQVMKRYHQSMCETNKEMRDLITFNGKNRKVKEPYLIIPKSLPLTINQRFFYYLDLILIALHNNRIRNSLKMIHNLLFPFNSRRCSSTRSFLKGITRLRAFFLLRVDCWIKKYFEQVY